MSETPPTCSCQTIYFYLNRLDSLPCRLNGSSNQIIGECVRQMNARCSSSTKDYVEQGPKKAAFLWEFVKFWEYCITEREPQPNLINLNGDDDSFNLQSGKKD